MSDDSDDSSVYRYTENDGEIEEWLASVDRPRKSNRTRSWNRGDVVGERSVERSALVFGTLGVSLVVGGLVLRDARSVLFALGGTGVFSGLLLYYLFPETRLSAQVCVDTHLAYARSKRALVEELGLREVQIYVSGPTGSTSRESGVRLFVPEAPDYAVPTELTSDSLFVTRESSGGRGIALYPSGADLFRRFRDTEHKPLADTPGRLATQLTEAITDYFELARTATATYDPERERITVEISGSYLGRVGQFDHPTVSLLAVGLAAELGRPIRVEVDSAGGSDGETIALDFV